MTTPRNRDRFSYVLAALVFLMMLIGYTAAEGAKKWKLTPLQPRPEDPDPTHIYDQNDFMAVPSPNGKLILFTSRRSGVFRQYVMNADGSNVHQITRGPGRQMQGAWAPDGKRIVYYQREGGGDTPFERHLIMCNADGSDPKTLAEIPGTWSTFAWMPDGKSVLYHAHGPNGGDDIWSVNVETGEREVVLGSPTADRQPWPSPDGRRIVFISKRDGDDDEIYVADTNGGPWRQLTDNNVNDYTPAWSPDGSRIVFQSPRAGRWTIFTIKPDGTEETPITPDLPAQYDPVWSADGKEIIFNSDREGRRSIFVMNADGQNIRRLTNPEPNTIVKVIEEDGVDEAARLFRDAHAKNPGAVYFYEEEIQYLGENYLEMGFLRHATVLFEINTEAFPESKTAHVNLAKTLLAAGENGRAIKSYERAHAIDPDDAKVSRILEQLKGQAGTTH